MVSVMLAVCIAHRGCLGPMAATRFGEASNPGPWHSDSTRAAADHQVPMVLDLDRLVESHFVNAGSVKWPPGVPSSNDGIPVCSNRSSLLQHGEVGSSDVSGAGSGQLVFIPAEKYDVPRSGLVFRLGDQGLGYYPDIGYLDNHVATGDATDTDQVLASLPHVVLSLDQSLFGQDFDSTQNGITMVAAVAWLEASVMRHAAADALDQSNRREGPWRPRTVGNVLRRRRYRDGKDACERMVEGNGEGSRPARSLPGQPLILTGSALGSFSRAERQHFRSRLWVFDSANPGGWSRSSEYINGSSADVVLLRETKLPPRGDKPAGRVFGLQLQAQWQPL